VLIGSVPSGARLVTARLDGADALSTDDVAHAIVPAGGTTPVLIVGPGNPYLENALALLPRVELYAVGEDGYADALGDGAEDGAPFGLVVFDGVVPDDEHGVPALYVDPSADGPFGEVAGRIETPSIASPDATEPLLRFVDLASVHIGRARDIELADGLRALVATGADDPLVAVGEADGRRLALIGFDLAESDLPLQVAFPLLTSNLVDFLVPEVEGLLPSSMRLGQAATIRVPPEVERVRLVTAGDTELAGGGVATLELPVVGGAVTIPGAEQVGTRELTEASDDPERDGADLGRTAVNLFSADESDVAPGDPQRIAAMGRLPDGDDTPSQPARSEWWWPLALAALALLGIEWLLFHRPTRQRLARAVGRRPQPLGGRAR
jgi:hypothetical protein